MNAPGWLLALYLAKGADLASTEYTLHSRPGVIELNPLAREAGARYALTIAGPVVVELTARQLEKRKHPRYALALRLSAIAAWSFAAAHNMRHAP